MINFSAGKKDFRSYAKVRVGNKYKPQVRIYHDFYELLTKYSSISVDNKRFKGSREIRTAHCQLYNDTLNFYYDRNSNNYVKVCTTGLEKLGLNESLHVRFNGKKR